MRENKKVAKIDLFNGKPLNVIELFSPEDMPIGTQGTIDFANKNIMSWHSSRAIPNGRINLNLIENRLGDVKYLSINSLGLSLTDHYWYREENSNITWEDVNFFDNDFNPDLFLLKNNLLDKQHLSPDYTTNGTLEKFWVICENKPYLMKAGGFNEGDKILAANEVAAYRIASILNIPATPYQKAEYNGVSYCICPSFIDSRNEEFVPLRHIEMQLDTQNNSFLVRDYLDKLGFSDYIDNLAIFNILIHNHDCHFDNAGLIRDVNTNEFIKECKLFDNGTSLNWNNIHIGSNNMKPFEQSLMDYANTINTTIELPDISKLELIITETYKEFEIGNKQTDIAITELNNGYDMVSDRFIEIGLKEQKIEIEN